MQKSEKEKLVQKLRRAADAQRRAYPGNIYHDGEAQGLDMAAGIIGKIRCEEEQHWIPCSERLPEDVLCVTLVTDGMNVWAETWVGIVGKWKYNHSTITAWMPLPEPYEEKEEKDGSD